MMLGFGLNCCGQSFAPGGVKAPVKWYVTDSSLNYQAFKSLTGGPDSLIFLNHGKVHATMNFHPALVFDGADTLSIRMPDSSMTGATFFSVYHSKAPNAEGTVWHLTNKVKTEQVLTTSRMADLENFQYLNFRDLYPSEPKVDVYTRQKLKDTVSPLRQYWRIGSKPASPVLPVFSFTGLIPEVIAYDRVLTPEERIKVGSYLAVKYGTTFSEPGATYLNSRGDVIWDGLEYPKYHHDIAGIERDDTSRLVQLRASSSNLPGLLTIATKDLDNYSSLLWGNNGEALSLDDKIPGVPAMLKKKWLLATHHNGRAITTDVTVNTNSMDVARPADPVYWLAIDRTGKGDMSLPSAAFIKMDSLDKAGNAHYGGIPWGDGNDSTEVMGIVVAQNLLASVSMTDPVCNEPNSGALKIKIIGGLAPFKVTLSKTTGFNVLDKTENGNVTETVNDLAAGKYVLKVSDAAHMVYGDSFYLNNADGPKPLAVAATYTLPQSGPVTIRADSLMAAGLIYEWNGPNGFHTVGPIVKITKTGTYTLKCGNGNCSYEQDISVVNKPSGIFSDRNVTVYPSPSQGHFTASITLDTPAPVKMHIRTVDGHAVGQAQQGSGMANYTFGGTINFPGLYLVEFTSGKYTVAKKLVVINQ